MKEGSGRLWLGALSALLLLGACGGASDTPPDRAAMERKAKWLQRFMEEQPAKAEQFSAECQQEVGIGFSAEAAVKLLDCMQRKAGVSDAPAK